MRDDLKKGIAGGVGGVCSVVVGHPFDTVKVRLQNQAASEGVLACVSRTVRLEGVRGLFRGVLLPAWGVFPLFTLYFGAYEAACAQLRALRGLSPDGELRLLDCALAGVPAGLAYSVPMVSACALAGECSWVRVRLTAVLGVSRKPARPPGLPTRLACPPAWPVPSAPRARLLPCPGRWRAREVHPAGPRPGRGAGGRGRRRAGRGRALLGRARLRRAAAAAGGRRREPVQRHVRHRGA